MLTEEFSRLRSLAKQLGGCVAMSEPADALDAELALIEALNHLEIKLAKVETAQAVGGAR